MGACGCCNFENQVKEENKPHDKINDVNQNKNTDEEPGKSNVVFQNKGNDEDQGKSNDVAQNKDNDEDSSYSNDPDRKALKNMAKKNWMIFLLTFGNDYKKRYTKFLEDYNKFLEFSCIIETTLYTLSFEKVKEIFEIFKINKTRSFIISDQFYNRIIDKNLHKRFKENINFCDDIYILFAEIVDIQIEIIISTIKIFQVNHEFNINNITYTFIKYFQDIGFCIKFFYYLLCGFILGDEFCGFEYHLDIRILYFNELYSNLISQSKIPTNLLQIAAESSKIKDTIILGDNQFKNHIKGLKLPCPRINDLDDNKLDSFFKNPFKENNIYKVLRYFIICDKNSEKKYLEEIQKLSTKYGFAYLFIIYLKNKNLADLRIELNEEKSCLYILEDDELLNIFEDNNKRLKPNLLKFLPKSDPLTIGLNELNKYIYKDIKNFKSTCEDGWDLFEYKKNNIGFKMNIIFGSFHDFIDKVLLSFYQSYEEHNSLEIFFKYYSKYLCLSLQPQLIINMTAYAKMILYAYSLEQNDANKNLYCIINDDLRSKIPQKVDRFLDLVKLIGGLIKIKNLKSFNGKLYRASFLKKELINKIKIGQTMTNSAFWSSTKKESVAKQFLNSNYKNALIITNGGLNNNVDIHLEGISQYPAEEEVLFLPFCIFTIKSFVEVKEGNLIYYKLELENNSDSSMIEPFNDYIIKGLNGKNNLF